jgi:hypothetical protein
MTYQLTFVEQLEEYLYDSAQTWASHTHVAREDICRIGVSFNQ